MEPKDSVGNILNNGDTVIVSKTLKVKGMLKTLKRGDKIKNIRTIGDPQNIELIKTNWLLKLSILKNPNFPYYLLAVIFFVSLT